MTKVKKSIFDYMTNEEYERYNALVAKAAELTANAPKAPAKPRGPLTAEAKLKMAESKRDALMAKIQELMAAQSQD